MDTEGQLLAVLVAAANRGDRDGARWLLSGVSTRWPALRKLWADQGYRGADWAVWRRDESGMDLEIVEPPAEQGGVAVQPRRWVGERSSAWLHRSRRLSKDYEPRAESTETGGLSELDPIAPQTALPPVRR